MVSEATGDSTIAANAGIKESDVDITYHKSYPRVELINGNASEVRTRSFQGFYFTFLQGGIFSIFQPYFVNFQHFSTFFKNFVG